MSMTAATPSDIAQTAAALFVGAVVGWLVGQSVAWSAVGGVVGIAAAAMILFVGVRPLVAVPVSVGAGIGAYVGGTIIGVICEPRGCPAFEATAATVTGIGALVGIGLVVALATRSFDEFRESLEHGAPPPPSASGTGEESD